MYTIGTELDNSVVKFVRALESQDFRSQRLFRKVRRALVKGVNKDHFKQFTERVTKLSGNNKYLVQKARKVYKLAKEWTHFKAVAKESELYYYNLEAVVKLFVYLNKEAPQHLPKVREGVKKAYTKGETRQEYNNKVREVLKELREQFGVVEVEGEFVKADFFKVVKEGLTHLNKEELQELLALVTEQTETEE